MAKYFIDTEFIEDGRTIDLISIGIVAESAAQQEPRTLYLQNSECDFSKASDWVWRNVYPQLLHFDLRGRRQCTMRERSTNSGLDRSYITKCTDNKEDYCPWATRREIRDSILDMCSTEKHGKPEFWGYYADYDWVAFCQLFGSMIELPKGYPMYCRDLKQLLDHYGNPRVQKDSVHHALADAQWIKETHAWLIQQPRP